MRETCIREGDYKRTCLCGERRFTKQGERGDTKRGESSSHRAGRDCTLGRRSLKPAV